MQTCNYIRGYCNAAKSWIISKFQMNTIHQPIQVPDQQDKNRKTLVLDLDETLVHSSFSYITDSDYQLSVKYNIEYYQTIRVGKFKYSIFVRLRPGVEEFLKEMAEYYEIIIFTASLREYANSVIDKLDQNGSCSIRLFRENCTIFNNQFVKDLSTINRDMNSIIIIDNNLSSFQLQPENGIHIKSFINDPTDTELLDLIPFLKEVSKVDDVRPVQEWMKKFQNNTTLQDTTINDTLVIQEEVIFCYLSFSLQKIEIENSLFIDKKKKGKKSKGLKFIVTEEIRDEVGMNSPNQQQQEVQMDYQE